MQFYNQDLAEGLARAGAVRVSTAEAELLMKSIAGVSEYQAMKMLRATEDGLNQRKTLRNACRPCCRLCASDYYLLKKRTRAGTRYVFTRSSDSSYVCTLTSTKAALVLELTGMTL